jgi:hypothetical protein
MSDKSTSAYIEFHNKANQFFFLLERDFLAAAEKVNREKEEYRFQQLKKNYVNVLKQQLEVSSQELIQKNGLARATGQNFNGFIKEYLYRFVQKINSY